MRLLRFAASAFAIYFYFRIGFPDGQGPVYHMLTPLLLLGFSIGYFFLMRMVETGAGLGSWALEALFVVLVAAYVGFTLPQTNGTPALQQLLENGRPSRATASQGLAKLGLDPHSQAGGILLALFP